MQLFVTITYIKIQMIMFHSHIKHRDCDQACDMQ